MTVADAQEVSPGITVAGRMFRPVTTFAFDQYNWVVAILATVDVDGVESLPDLTSRVAEAGVGASLLAGLYTEEVLGDPVTWTPTLGRDLKRLFANVRDIATCALMQVAIAQALPGFFPGVTGISGATVTSSNSASPTPTTSEAGTNDPSSRSASSASSSSASPGTT